MSHTDDTPPPAVDHGGQLLPAHLEHFRRRTLYEALLEATAAHWLRRADTFAAVGTPRCDEIALACCNKAAFLTMYGLDAEARAVIDDILGTPTTAVSA